jgi:hypothetical protein
VLKGAPAAVDAERADRAASALSSMGGQKMKHEPASGAGSADLILEVKGSHLPGEHAAGHIHLRIYADKIVTNQRVGVHKRHATVPMSDIKGVGIERHQSGFMLFFDTVGHEEVRVPGLSATDAQEARQQVQRLMAALREQIAEAARAAEAVPAAPPSRAGVDEQLRELNALRASGAISDDEFNQRKAELFGRDWRHG